MRAYLGLVARAGRIGPELLEAAEAAAREAIPVPFHELRAERWLADGVALLGWSNEPEHELLPRPLAGSLGYCGYLGDPARDEPRLREAADLGAVAETLGGCFSIFRAVEGGVEAATSIARVCPVYYAQTDDVLVCGSRALLVHLVARAAETGRLRPSVDIDVLALQPMVRHGFFTNDETPYRGVRALPPASVLRMRRSLEVVEGGMPEVLPAPRSLREARARVSGLAEALVEAARPLARHGDPVMLALSGGRDSRIMAAVLTAAGVPLKARTHGYADEPDVVLGTRIAQALGIPHTVEASVAEEREDSVVVEHPLARAHAVIRMCEGMTSAYERVTPWRPYKLQPSTSGSGGETLRGGFLYDQKDLSGSGLRARVRSIFLSGERFCTPEAQRRAEADHAPWAERAETDGYDVLDKLYLFYRTGRWIVGSHTATLMNCPYYHPFFDNRVVREALTLPALWRCNEEPVYRLIEALAPELVRIPPEGRRWKFDRSRPRNPARWKEWRERQAMLARGRTAAFNWRTAFDDDFQAILREQVMGSPRELFEVFDEQAVKELMSGPRGRPAKQMWHLFTMSVLVSGQWRESLPALPSVTIPIPR